MLPDQPRPPEFELGPIRPPSEAYSLLVRVTRNCPWNRCAFCPVYKGRRFEKRSVEEVKADIRAMKQWSDYVRTAAQQLSRSDDITRDALHQLYESDRGNPCLRSIVIWMLDGARTAFLQDADSLVIPAQKLAELLQFLRETLPSLERVTSYSRSSTVWRRSPADLQLLRQSGLDRVHVGLESGSDRVLQMVAKGVTAERHLEAGRKARAAGFELSEYVMPGLGGRELWREHAEQTAAVLNAIKPHFIRVRTLAVTPGSPLHEQVLDGTFTIPNDFEMARELRLFLEKLEGLESRILSDHMLNLFQELEGKLPEDKTRLLSLIDRFFALPEPDQLAFILGRRIGMLRSLGQMDDPVYAARAHALVTQAGIESPEQLHHFIQKIVTQFV